MKTDPESPASLMVPALKLQILEPIGFLQVPKTQVPVVYAVLKEKSLSFRRV